MEVKATRVLVPGSIVPGIGYMTRTQTVCIKAVEGEVVEKPNEWAPSYDIDYVGTYESLNKFYSLSASARYSGASGGASASVSIMRTAKLERSVVILAVKVRASTGRIFFTEPKLTRDAHDWAKAGMPGYVAKFGDSYVRSITYGGEVAALLVVSASSSESLRLLRARAEAHGFGASGETNTTNMIQEVSKENKVRVIYNQSGGGAGEDSGGIIEIAPKELLERMSAFIAELRKTDPLKGSVIPLEAEFWPATKTLNWPGGDPAHPFPPDIENIAETLDMLRDRLDRTNHIIQNSADFPPSTSEAASVIKAYIETTVTGAGIHLRQMIEDKLAVASLPLETLAQYRLRGLCGVEPGLHENAGPRMDANSVDKAQLANTLIGPDTFPRIDRWPQFELLEDWGYHGEDRGVFLGPWWRCAKGEVHTEESVTWPWAGKTSADDGIFTHASVSTRGVWHKSGDHCGYQEMYIFALKFLNPDGPQLAPLPTLPTKPGPQPLLEQEPPKRGNGDQWVLAFKAKTGDMGTACAYYITVTEKSKNGARTFPLKAPYWMSSVSGPVHCKHIYLPDPGWQPTSWELKLGQVYEFS